jgi:hypothetical protein
VRTSGDCTVVRHYHHGVSSLFSKFPQEVQNFHAGGRVKVARRLIRQQNHRAVRKRPSDRYPLLLATGQLRGQMGRSRAESNVVQ